MKKLYEKSELAFAIVCIAVYCALQSLANPLNRMIGIGWSASAVFCLAQAVAIAWFLKKNGLLERYGLCGASAPARRFLYYVPLIVLATRNLWNGAAIDDPPGEVVCRVACMLCVGFVEEVVFRGFLFKAIAKDDVKTAVAISSVTFGLGHLLNLVNGSGMELAANLFQVVGAIAFGFLFVIIFDRGGSLIPCILAHAAINVSGTFARGSTVEQSVLFDLIMLAVATVYALFLMKTLPKKKVTVPTD